MFTLVFWRATLERAISTAAQFMIYHIVGIGMIAGAVVPDAAGEALNSFGWNWLAILSAGCAGFILTVLKCLAVAKATDGGPSLTDAEYLPRVEAAKNLMVDPDKYKNDPPVV